MKLKTLAPWTKSYDRIRQHIKKQRHYFTNKGVYSQSYGFSSSHIWMWELGYKESWGLKNWWFWTVMLEMTFESSLDCKEIQPVHPKGNQLEYSLEGLILKLKLPYFGHLMGKTDSVEKTVMLGKIEGGRRRGWQRMRWLDGISNTTDMSLSRLCDGSWWWTEKPGKLQSMGSQSQTCLSNWTEKIMKEVSFKILCCHDDTWFHLNLTFLNPWANQCVFLMEIFVLSYVNKLCIYYRFSSSQLDSEPIRAQQTSMFYSYIVLLMYIN